MFGFGKNKSLNDNNLSYEEFSDIFNKLLSEDSFYENLNDRNTTYIENINKYFIDYTNKYNIKAEIFQKITRHIILNPYVISNQETINEFIYNSIKYYTNKNYTIKTNIDNLLINFIKNSKFDSNLVYIYDRLMNEGLYDIVFNNSDSTHNLFTVMLENYENLTLTFNAIESIPDNSISERKYKSSIESFLYQFINYSSNKNKINHNKHLIDMLLSDKINVGNDYIILFNYFLKNNDKKMFNYDKQFFENDSYRLNEFKDFSKYVKLFNKKSSHEGGNLNLDKNNSKNIEKEKFTIIKKLIKNNRYTINLEFFEFLNSNLSFEKEKNNLFKSILIDELHKNSKFNEDLMNEIIISKNYKFIYLIQEELTEITKPNMILFNHFLFNENADKDNLNKIKESFKNFLITKKFKFDDWKYKLTIYDYLNIRDFLVNHKHRLELLKLCLSKSEKNDIKFFFDNYNEKMELEENIYFFKYFKNDINTNTNINNLIQKSIHLFYQDTKKNNKNINENNFRNFLFQSLKYHNDNNFILTDSNIINIYYCLHYLNVENLYEIKLDSSSIVLTSIMTNQKCDIFYSLMKEIEDVYFKHKIFISNNYLLGEFLPLQLNEVIKSKINNVDKEKFLLEYINKKNVLNKKTTQATFLLIYLYLKKNENLILSNKIMKYLKLEDINDKELTSEEILKDYYTN